MDMIVSFPGGLKVDAEYKGFTVKTDQPEGEGGENTAPSPFDLFFCSVGTCAGFYVLSFCRERDENRRGDNACNNGDFFGFDVGKRVPQKEFKFF